MDEDDIIAAGEQVLGLRPTADAQNPSLLHLAWESALAPLGEDGHEVRADALWEQIQGQLDAQDDAPATRTVRVDDGAWEALAPGIWRKVLHVDRGAGTVAFYIRMDAGAELPAHQHRLDEHCVVLSGSLEIGNTIVPPGAYHLAREGIDHAPIRAREPSLFFIHGAL